MNQPTSNGRLESSNDEFLEFDLGDIRSSKHFGFNLANGGQNSINDISIISDNDFFNFSPTKINSLKSVSIGLTQIIGLDVVHGKAINGSALSNIQNKGDNYCNVTITGTTKDDKNQTIQLKTVVKFKINAKVMDLSFYDGSQKIYYETISGSCLSCIKGSGATTLWCDSTKMTLENTGNVNIKVNYGESSNDINTSETVEIGKKITFNLSNKIYYLEIDGSNTVVDENKFKYFKNGKVYFISGNFPGPPRN